MRKVIKVFILIYVAVLTILISINTFMQLRFDISDVEDMAFIGFLLFIVVGGVGSFVFNVLTYSGMNRPQVLQTAALDADITLPISGSDRASQNKLSFLWIVNLIFAITGFGLGILGAAVSIEDGSQMDEMGLIITMILISMSSIILVDSIRWKKQRISESK